jgi:signal transduction histidine kinase
MLDQLITSHREEIIARTRAKVAARSVPRPADIELDKGIPIFLDQLSEILRHSMSRSPSMNANAARHGGDLLRMGFSVSQVVHGYGDVCQAVTELAIERNASIATDEFRIFNRCLDEAIASAVTEYERQREAGICRKGTERLGVLAHELRNSLSAALLSFSILKRGVVGPESSTGAVLNRSLLRLRDLIDRSLSEVRLESGNLHLERVLITDLIQEVAISSALDASSRGVSLIVAPFEARLEVEADRHLLIGAVENIVQNALKFTPRNGHVSLTVHELDGQILVDVEDECGGLPAGKIDLLFDAFQQHGVDRSGLGLGLGISRASVTAMGGTLAARDLPAKGCVFTLSLPKLARAQIARTHSKLGLAAPS